MTLRTNPLKQYKTGLEACAGRDTGTCTSSGCLPDQVSSGACDDGNLCTTDDQWDCTGCEVYSGGVIPNPIENPAARAAQCTGCSPGPTRNCVAELAIPAADSECNEISCDPATGCVFAFVDTSCSLPCYTNAACVESTDESFHRCVGVPDDGATCSTLACGGDDGVCVDGACACANECGNGYLEADNDEECDDSDDVCCSASCTTIECDFQDENGCGVADGICPDGKACTEAGKCVDPEGATSSDEANVLSTETLAIGAGAIVAIGAAGMMVARSSNNREHGGNAAFDAKSVSTAGSSSGGIRDSVYARFAAEQSDDYKVNPGGLAPIPLAASPTLGASPGRRPSAGGAGRGGRGGRRPSRGRGGRGGRGGRTRGPSY